ncbi:MAG TPA: class I SAM-dependent methyltransferase [Jatrophihabitans sp.]|nr:class I SAM-dependent methyltransferase [Jatrophihabitans sp.]
MTAPILPLPVLDRLGVAVRRNFGSAQVNQALGLLGQAALSRSDLAGVRRAVGGGTPTEVLIRLFLLGLPVPRNQVADALAPLTVAEAVSSGLLVADADEVLAALDLRPYSEEGGPDWWVLSDLGADVRPGRLDPEHVLGIGQAATTLAQAVIRDPVSRALDIGTGSGVQALHLSRHAASVTGTDISSRALSFAAANAHLNGLNWQLRAGSLLQPVTGEQFDLVVCNPPFIVGPGFTADDVGFTYRDSGFSSDGVSRQLVSGLPGVLAEGGTAQLLANWVIGPDGAGPDRVAGWLPEHGVDAWIWQREVAEPGEYVSLWLRDGGEQPGTPLWQRRYDGWLDWFAREGVAAVGMGLVTIRRTDRASHIVAEDVPQAYQPPIGPAISGWLDRAAWLASADLLGSRLRAAPDLVRTDQSLLAGEEGWQPRLTQLRQSGGMRWELEADDAVCGLVAACTGGVTVGVLLQLVAELSGLPADDVRAGLVPVVADLVARGFLLPGGAG